MTQLEKLVSDNAKLNLGELVQVTVKTHFIDDQSDPLDERYVFSYTITITNHSDQQVQLLSRNWLITDADGKNINVQGDGVVGQQPKIQPGKHYTYSSGSVLKTPVGSMQGYYTMVTAKGDVFQAEIPAFNLSIPNILH